MQKFLLAVGGLAGALIAIGGVISFGATLLGDDDGGGVGPAGGAAQRIENQSERADAFVRFLIAADGKAPLQLDHHVLAPRGPGCEFGWSTTAAPLGMQLHSTGNTERRSRPLHQGNAKLQLTVVLGPFEHVDGLYLHPDHRRRLRRPPVSSGLDDE